MNTDSSRCAAGPPHPRSKRCARRVPAFFFLCLAFGLTADCKVVAQPAPGPTLEECITAALEANPGVQAAELRVTAAGAAVKQAGAAFSPVFSVAANATRTDNPTQTFMMQLNQRRLDMADPAFDPNTPEATDNVRLSAEARYRLFDGGRRSLRRHAARVGETAASHKLAAARNELIHEVTRNYYRLLQAQALIEVQRASQRSIQESLRVARERLDAGSAVKTDVLNLEVELAQAEEDLIRALNRKQLSAASLNTAIGDVLVGNEDVAPPPPQTPARPPRQDLDAVQHRPELAALKAGVALRATDLRRATRDYAPVVNAFGSYHWDSEALDDVEDSYVVGLAAEWELFAGGRTPHTVARARAEWRAAQHDEQETRSRLRLDLHTAHLQAVEAAERLNVLRKSVESAEEALRITRERYQQGAAEITELLFSQVALTAVQTRHITARYDYLIALSNVRRARGDLVREYTDYGKGSQP